MLFLHGRPELFLRHAVAFQVFIEGHPVILRAQLLHVGYLLLRAGCELRVGERVHGAVVQQVLGYLAICGRPLHVLLVRFELFPDICPQVLHALLPEDAFRLLVRQRGPVQHLIGTDAVQGDLRLEHLA